MSTGMTDEDKKPREIALEAVPPEWRETLIEKASASGIKQSDDIFWFVVGSVIDAWAAAAESGRAAESIGNSIDQLTHSLNQVPEQSKQSVLDAGRSAGDELQQVLRRASQEQADIIRQAVDEANKKVDQERRNRWREMLEEFDAEVSSVQANQKQQIESYLAQASRDFAQANHKRSLRRLIVTAAAAFAFVLAITIAGVTYTWQTFQGPNYSNCKQASNGAIWCRVSGSGQ